MCTYLNTHTQVSTKVFFSERNAGSEVLGVRWFGEWVLES